MDCVCDCGDERGGYGRFAVDDEKRLSDFGPAGVEGG